MTTGWTELGREIDVSGAIHWYIGEPVAGDPAPYAAGAEAYGEMATHIRSIGTVFDDYTGSDNPQFQGEAARAFNGLAETIREQLTLIPGIADGVAGILSEHQAGLTRLQADADTALAQARTRWRRLESARSELRAAEDAFELQAADLLTPTDDGRLIDAEDEVNEARRLLLQSRDEAQDLIDSESALETATSDGLRNLDLGDMADPGFWDKLGGALWDFVLTIPIIGDALAFAHAVISRDWDRAIWRLRDLLDDILLVATVIAVVLAVTFTGGAALALLAIAITKLVIDIGLHATGSEDPDNPGRTIGKFDIALSALAVVGAGANLGLNPQAGLIERGGRTLTSTGGTSIVQRSPHLMRFSNWVNAKPTTWLVADTATAVDEQVTWGVGLIDTGVSMVGVGDQPPEIVQRTQILDAAVDAQVAEVESGENLNDVFVWPPSTGGFNLVTTGAESDD